jgi:hypothetical protein
VTPAVGDKAAMSSPSTRSQSSLSWVFTLKADKALGLTFLVTQIARVDFE